MLTFQQIIATLNHFWEKKGCIIHLGHDVETGAGTFNPVTFLRCLGPEPYLAGYVEPSRRPKDGRYGENPNRIQLFHQYQVIIKPSPMDIQKSYIDSLEALGLNLKEHDIRFVHDDWESPTLGAFGLGWEVWIDGMEVTQFTYFQGLANLPLSPITVELAYGIERLAMYLQNVDNMFDVKWNETFTLGDLIKRNEVEWSTYNFTAASTEMWLRHFEDYAAEAKSLIARGMSLPAYDFLIKASHAFNMLEARGVISVTERTGYIGRIRELARLVAGEYLTAREKQGFPLLEKAPKEKPLEKLPPLPSNFSADKREDFLLEVGSEQLPATFVPIGMNGLKRHMEKLLKESGLKFERIDLFGTPRRLTIIVRNLSEATPKTSCERKGPATENAFDPSGKPSKQGAGFLKSIDCENATLQEIKEGSFPHLSVRDGYLFAQVNKGGESVYAILSAQLPKLILNIEFPKKMRWGAQEITYARPIHWIVSLYGSQVIPFQLGNVTSSHFTFGHAQRKPEKITLDHAGKYVERLKKEGDVIVDVKERRALIETELTAIESRHHVKALEVSRVTAEVVHLTEWPELAYATFDDHFLKVPSEVLISEMIQHQRYFPLTGEDGKLKNSFVITADNQVNELIIAGNQKVLSARLSDGVFLYEQDLKTPLIDFNQKLQMMTFQKELGSVLDKVMRIAACAETLNGVLKIADSKKVARGALLLKADLATELVGEFPELQGTIGKYYALASGEDEEVATAIEEHWLPTSEKGALPQSSLGIILSLADKIDNLLSYFRIGLKPTSSSDPYALRRQTIGILKTLIKNDLSLDLFQFLKQCDPIAPIEEILQYITSRAKALFEEFGYSKDAIEASIRGMIHDPCDQLAKVKALDAFRSGDSFTKLFEVYRRAKGQLSEQVKTAFDPALATEPAEKKLLLALDALSETWVTTLKARNYTRAFESLATLQSPLAELFDTVKILADDKRLKENRIALLQKVFGLFEELLDFSKIQGV